MAGITRKQKQKVHPRGEQFQAVDVKSMIALKADGLDMQLMSETFNVSPEIIRRVYASYTAWAIKMAGELNNS